VVSAGTAAVVVAWVLAAEPTLGKGRLVCVDGPAGAGKTTLAGALVDRYDWGRSTYAEEHEVEPCDVLVVEGVGAGATAYDEAITCLLWVETPRDLCLARGLARDGEAMRDHWLAWRVEEERMFDQERTEMRADLVVDGRTGEFAGPPTW
jgi:uridine kinase